MIKLYNSLTRKVEDFVPMSPDHVGVYTCGPTVYNFAHIGNFRTYATSDLLVRMLEFNGLRVKYIMNLTDVGHLTGDNAGDADTGEDRIEKAAEKEGKSAWEVAEFYTAQFLEDYKALNLTPPDKFAKATDHIREQIALIQTLEEKGYTYETSDGVYFDTAAFPEYGKLSNLDQIKEGARVGINPEKRNPRDFALWKFSEKKGERPADEVGEVRQRRHMEWKSPWGKGFPGWHIECSAMSMKYLGETFDIHTGGIDLKETHHPNEIAQSEAATGKPFVNYWIHSAFMLVQGERMSKSEGNNYRLYDLTKMGYDPLALRYLYMLTHYRQEMNFTFPALDAATQAVLHLKELVVGFKNNSDDGDRKIANEYEDTFFDAIDDDLNTPQAIAAMWELIKSDASNTAKFNSIMRMDKILGLGLEHVREEKTLVPFEEVPKDVQMLIEERMDFRRAKRFNLADQWRNKIKKRGFELLDGKNGLEIRKI
jgi:cysteinyl-tRNA synthetase